jgi:hypothetical protein
MNQPSITNPHFREFNSVGSTIHLREEFIGEIGKWVDGSYWHLNRPFDGRRVFFGSGIDSFIDPQEYLLVLRDAGVILLFDYSTDMAWHAESPWGHREGVTSFPEIEFTPDAILIGSLRMRVARDRLEDFFQPGLGRFQDGFLSHWRPQVGQDSEYSRRLRGAVYLFKKDREQAAP